MRTFKDDQAYLEWLCTVSDEDINDDIADVLSEIDLPEEETHGAE